MMSFKSQQLSSGFSYWKDPQQRTLYMTSASVNRNE